MEKITRFWDLIDSYILLENNLQNVVICSVILFFAFIFKRFLSVQFNKFIFRFLKNLTSNIPVKEFVNLLRTPIELFITLLLIYVAFTFIDYPEKWHLSSERKIGLKMFVNRGYQLVLFFSIIWTIFRLIDFFSLVLKKQAKESASKVQEQLVPFMRQLTKLVVGLVSFFVMLAVIFKVNVGAVITGLGIGGVAVALAGKETLENLLASFSIFLDRPFVTGDIIKAGQYMGNVESVGFRTTRIRTLDKSLLTIPNKQLVDQPLENLSSRKTHRAKFSISLPYNASSELMQTIIKKIETEIKEHQSTNESYFVFFEAFTAYTMEITVSYNVIAVEYEDFWRVKEELNYKIKKVIEDNGINFEYPTSIVYLRNENDAKLTS